MSKLNNNTEKLEALLAKINALPEAGEGGVDTSDATATAEEIFAGETAYGANGKITGTFTIEEEITEQDSLIAEIKTALAGKAGGGTSQPVIEPIIITNNGTFTAPQGVDGYSPITVNVAGSGGGSDEMTAFIEGYLVDLYNDSATSVTDNIFNNNFYLETVKLPNVEDINTHSFHFCTSLRWVDLSQIQSIYGNAFYGCESLTSLVIRNTEAIPELWETNALGATPIADGYGYIYVPAVLLASYQSAENWSMYAEQFRPLEDYTSDGTVTGEFIPPEEEVMLPIIIFKNDETINTGLYIIAEEGMNWWQWYESEYNDGQFEPRVIGLRQEVVECNYRDEENTNIYYVAYWDENSEEFIPATPNQLINWSGDGLVAIMSAADLGLA